MFGNIPLILQPITATDDYYNIPQTEPQKVYEQIESDIVASINDLPLSIAPTNKAEVGRISEGQPELSWEKFICITIRKILLQPNLQK